jgi:hypothetical protein
MFDWLKKLLRPHSPSTTPVKPSLLDFAQNYLAKFSAGDDDEKVRHVQRLIATVNEMSAEVGARDFPDLITKDNETLTRAAVYARTKFDDAKAPPKEGYWLATNALAHLMVLNHGKVLEDNPRAKKVAENATALYSAMHARKASE